MDKIGQDLAGKELGQSRVVEAWDLAERAMATERTISPWKKGKGSRSEGRIRPESVNPG